MKRVCFKLDIEPFLENITSSKRNIEFFVDEKNYKDILVLCKEKHKKFRRILCALVSGEDNTDLYGDEEVSYKAKHIKAMKFGKKENLRIYCKEFHNGRLSIVMIEVYAKKVRKASSKKLKKRLEVIGGYEYEFR